MISLEKVSFAYDAERVIDGVDLTIREGEFVTVLGRNGSGKSTLAKLLNGLLVPTEGRVLVQGLCSSDQENVWKIRRLVGVVFQNPDNQFVAPTVMDDVAFGLENLGVPREEMMERVEWALRQTRMWEYREREPHRLSGGQKQRVAVAGVLAMKPKAIVFDESTAMLDPNGRKQLMKTMLDLRDEGIAIIHITHFPDEVVHAVRLLALERGTVAFVGAPRELFQDVDRLRALRLDAPFAVELARRLREKGVPLAKDIWTTDELVERLWTLC